MEYNKNDETLVSASAKLYTENCKKSTCKMSYMDGY